MVAQIGPAIEAAGTRAAGTRAAGTRAAGTRLSPELHGLLTSPDELKRDLLRLEPGRVVGLIGHPGFGLTRIGLSLLAAHAGKAPVAYLDVRGWLCPVAAWESGMDPEQLIVVRCEDPVRWGRALTALLEGVGWIYAEVPRGVKEAQLRRIAGLVRNRKSSLILRPVQGDLPSGVAFLRIQAEEVGWAGTDRGHGRLTSRVLSLAATGKATRGMTRSFEVEDDGADALRVVSGLAAAPSGRATG